MNLMIFENLIYFKSVCILLEDFLGLNLYQYIVFHIMYLKKKQIIFASYIMSFK